MTKIFITLSILFTIQSASADVIPPGGPTVIKDQHCVYTSAPSIVRAVGCADKNICFATMKCDDVTETQVSCLTVAQDTCPDPKTCLGDMRVIFTDLEKVKVNDPEGKINGTSKWYNNEVPNNKDVPVGK